MFIIISVMFFIAGIQYSSEVQFELTQHHKKYSDRRAADVRLRTYTDISRVISFLVHFRFDASQPGLMFMWEYGDSEADQTWGDSSFNDSDSDSSTPFRFRLRFQSSWLRFRLRFRLQHYLYERFRLRFRLRFDSDCSTAYTLILSPELYKFRFKYQPRCYYI